MKNSRKNSPLLDPKDCKHLALRGEIGLHECPDCHQTFRLKTVTIHEASNSKHKTPYRATQAVPSNNLGWYLDEALTIGDPL